jgi:hypothetical protein
MPYVSDQQRKWAHTEAGTEALGGPEKVHEWDEATKDKKLPKRKHPKKEEKAVAPAPAPVRMRHTAKPR